MADHDRALRAESEPGTATAEQGLVVLDGPGGVALTMTADAAIRTGESLIAAGLEARNQVTDADVDE
jgi:hypothetical protein